MTLRTIVAIPEPVLRRKAHKITTFDKDLQILVDDMIETMRQAPGVGLAAPQINISSRLIVVEFGDEENEEAPKKLFVVINPELIFISEEKVTGVEGCLSVPGIVGEVERYNEVLVKGLNRQGKPTRIKAKGWLARIFQHEIDHIDGIVYTDRAGRIWQPKAEEEIKDV